MAGEGAGFTAWARWYQLAVLAAVGCLFLWDQEGAFSFIDTSQRRPRGDHRGLGPGRPPRHRSPGDDAPFDAVASLSLGDDDDWSRRGEATEPSMRTDVLPDVPTEIVENETMTWCSEEDAAMTNGSAARGGGGHDDSGFRRRAARLPTATEVSLDVEPKTLARALRGKLLRVTVDEDRGLLSGVVSVVNHLALLERIGAPDHCVHVSIGARDGNRPWEHFFESPTDRGRRPRWQRQNKGCPDPHFAPAVRLDAASLRRLNEAERGSVFAFPRRGVHDDVRGLVDANEWYGEQRERTAGVVETRLRPARRVRCRVAAFWRDRLAQNTTWDGSKPGPHKVKTKGIYHGTRAVFRPTVLGVHVAAEGVGGGRRIEAREYFRLVDSFLDNRALDGKVLLVTDSSEAVSAMAARYGSRLVTTASLARDGDGGAYSYAADVDRHLCEALLLARVDTLIKPASVLAEAAVWFSNRRLLGRTLEMHHLYGYDARRRYPNDGYAEDAISSRGGDGGVTRDEGSGNDDYESPQVGEEEEGTMMRQRRNKDKADRAREALWTELRRRD